MAKNKAKYMTIKEQILNYADVINENVTTSQVGATILKNIKREYSESQIFTILDNLTEKKWLRQTPSTGKVRAIVIDPFNQTDTEKTQNVSSLVIANVPNEFKAKVKGIFEKWIAHSIDEIKRNNPGVSFTIRARNS